MQAMSDRWKSYRAYFQYASVHGIACWLLYAFLWSLGRFPYSFAEALRGYAGFSVVLALATVVAVELF